MAGALPWCGQRPPPPAPRLAGTPAQQIASLWRRSRHRGKPAGGGADPSTMPPTPHRVMLPQMSCCAQEGCQEAKGWTGRCPDRQRHPSRCSRLCWPQAVPVHTHGDWGAEGEPRGGAAACFAWAFLEHRLWFGPASCQVVAAQDVEAAVLSVATVAAFFGVLALAPAVVDAAGAAAAALSRVGAGSRDSATSRRRVLITPSRDAIWRRSEAIIAYSAVGGGGGGLGGSTAPLAPLGTGAAARGPLVDSRGRCTREKKSQRHAYGCKDRGAL